MSWLQIFPFSTVQATIPSCTRTKNDDQKHNRIDSMRTHKKKLRKDQSDRKFDGSARGKMEAKGTPKVLQCTREYSERLIVRVARLAYPPPPTSSTHARARLFLAFRPTSYTSTSLQDLLCSRGGKNCSLRKERWDDLSSRLTRGAQNPVYSPRTHTRAHTHLQRGRGTFCPGSRKNSSFRTREFMPPPPPRARLHYTRR